MTHNGTAPSHYDLHVWAYERNPRGSFEQYNPRVRCPYRAPAAASCESLFAT